MKQLSKFIFVLSLISTNLYADETDMCNNLDNYLKRDENPKGCRYQNEVVINPIYDVLRKINTSLYQSCDEEIKSLAFTQNRSSSRKKQSQVEICNKITSCFNEIKDLVKSYDASLFCSIKDLESIHAQALKEGVVSDVMSELTNEDSSTRKVEQINHIVLQQVGNLKDQIKSCENIKANKSCFNEYPGFDMDLINKVYDFNKTDEFKKTVSAYYEILKREKLEKAQKKDEKMRASSRMQNQFFALVGSDNKSDSNVPFSPKSSAENSFSLKITSNDHVNFVKDVEKLVREFDIDISDLKSKYYDESGMLRLGHLEDDSRKKYLIDLANRVNERKCSETTKNENLICMKVAGKMKEERSRKRNGINVAYKFISANKEDSETNFNGFNPEMIKQLSSISGFDFNNYLDISEQNIFCINKFGQNSFTGDNAFKHYQAFLKQEQVDSQRLKDKVFKQTKANLVETANFFGKNEDENSSFMKRRLIEFTDKIENNNGKISQDRLLNESQIRTAQSLQSNLEKNQSIVLPQSMKPIQSDETSFNNPITNLNKALPKNSDENNFIQNQNEITHINSNYNQDTIKKLAELEEREKALKKKADEKVATANESEEMKQLRLQIEELRGQLAKKDNVDALGNKMLAGKDNAGPSSASTAAKFPTAINLPSSTSAIVSKRDSRDTGSERETYAASTSRSNYSDLAPSSAQDIRSPAAVGGAKAAVFGSKGSGSSAFGLALTRSGDVTEDLSKIADNPKEAELFIMAEKSNGKPFIIRENGLLVQVIVEKDDAGKAIMENGKPKLKKIKLTKDKEALVAREFNVVREAKTVRDTVRLQELRRTTEDAVK